MATSDSPLSVPDITLAVAISAGSDPEPSGPLNINSVTLDGNALVISGSGFGTKETGPTEILYDGGDFVRENGVENSYRAGLADGAVINLFGTEYPSEIYRGGAGGITLLSKTGLRGDNCTAKYVSDPASVPSTKFFFGAAEAEIPGGADIPYHEKLHARWWIKWRYAFSKLKTLANWTVTSGEFIYPDLQSDPNSLGEELVMGDTGIVGYLLYHDGNKTSVYTPNSTEQFEVDNGTVITGVTSGATATISREGDVTSNVGTDYYGVEKVFRGYSRVDGSGNRYTIEQYKSSYGGAADYFVDITRTYEDEWVPLDVVVNLTDNTAKFYANGALYGEMTGMDIDTASGLVVVAIGWQNVRSIFNVIEFGDIYIDHDLECVYLGNAPAWGDCTVTELQPIRWNSDSQVTVETIRTGALDLQAPVYVFVTRKGVPDASDTGAITTVGTQP